MIFESKLIPGTFIKRYKRFFVDVKSKGKVITTHCPNTGSMLGLIKKGNNVFFTANDNPKRKLRYTLQMIEVNGDKVGINTHIANKIFEEALQKKQIKEFNNFNNLTREVKFDNDTRFDFLIEKDKKKTFIEVKNVTLSRKKDFAEFPDAITSRGLKHLKKLIKAKKRGYGICLAFVIQRENCQYMKIAKDIDKNYFELLTIAKKNDLKIICYDCKFSSKGIDISKKVKFLLND